MDKQEGLTSLSRLLEQKLTPEILIMENLWDDLAQEHHLDKPALQNIIDLATVIRGDPIEELSEAPKAKFERYVFLATLNDPNNDSNVYDDDPQKKSRMEFHGKIILTAIEMIDKGVNIKQEMALKMMIGDLFDYYLFCPDEDGCIEINFNGQAANNLGKQRWIKDEIKDSRDPDNVDLARIVLKPNDAEPGELGRCCFEIKRTEETDDAIRARLTNEGISPEVIKTLLGKRRVLTEIEYTAYEPEDIFGSGQIVRIRRMNTDQGEEYLIDFGGNNR